MGFNEFLDGSSGYVPGCLKPKHYKLQVIIPWAVVFHREVYF